MLCIYLRNTDPFYCLAAEEYLLKQFKEDIFMLWQSEDTVVVGKHQNLLAEINYPYVKKKRLTLSRRISGGGTVFHDAGNVNFTFIRNVKSPAEISFKQFTQPIVESLGRLGIEAHSSGRNDLLINGLKISGNAEHVFKNRVLHHGTLLFRSNLESLGDSIRVIKGKYTSKAVQSNRSKVTNISSYLDQDLSTEQFIQFLLRVQMEDETNSRFEFTETDHQAVQELCDTKFRSWEWIFGYSPKYKFQNKLSREGKMLHIAIEVRKGIIQDSKLSGDYFNSEEIEHYSGALVNQKHDWDTIQTVFGEEDQELVASFF